VTTTQSSLKLNDLPESARLWVFSSRDPLDDEACRKVNEGLSKFIATWKAHGSAVSGAFEIRERKFILVAADIEVVQVSGCSIDSLFRSVKEIIDALELALSDVANVFYRADNTVIELTRPGFKSSFLKGEISEDTLVYDPSIQTVGDLKRGKFELPVSESWHAQLLPGQSAR